MSSAFNLLTAGGARFDKSRFKHDHDLFAGRKVDKGKQKAKPAPAVAAALPSSLNFFSDRQDVAQSSKQTAPEEPESEEDDEDAESNAEGSSSTPAPAPPVQKITITGSDPLPRSLYTNLPSLVSHDSAPLASSAGKPLLKALESAHIRSLWGVQTAVGGCILEDKDVMCIAPTGSGKTLSYVLPTLVRLRDPARNLRGKSEGRGIRALVIVPTHDLAVQILGVVKAVTIGRNWRCMILTKATEKAVCDSAPGAGEHDSSDGDEADGELEDGALDEDVEEDGETSGQGSSTDAPLGIDMLIATPERLHHLLENGLLSLAATRHLILDESDRLLSPDFLPQIAPIVEACSNTRLQTSLFSATMPSGPEEIARGWLRDGGVRVVVGLKDSAVLTVSQSLLYTASESGKILALRNLIASGDLPYPSLIFTQSIERADELGKILAVEGLRVEVVHGNRSVAKRDEAIRHFREGSVWVLVVTEVLARGMDFRGVKVVINYDFPQTVQSYIHRIGRTGRAGRPGRAITFFSTEDAPHLRTIANVLRASGCEVPEYMLNMPKPGKNAKRQMAKAPVKRKRVGGGGRDVQAEQAKKRKAMVKASKLRKGADSRTGQTGKARSVSLSD